MVLPNFLGIGAMRAGSTWLHNTLKTHPKVYVPENRKEIHYFTRYYDRGDEWYESFFPPAKQYELVGEVTPNYLENEGVPERVKETLDNPRFIVILRNPVDRLFSNYTYRHVAKDESFDEFVENDSGVIQRGMYAKHLKRWFEVFSKDDFLILLFEEIIDDENMFHQKLGRFLNVDPQYFDSTSNQFESFIPKRFSMIPYVAERVSQWMRYHDIDWLVEIGMQAGMYDMIKKLCGEQSKPKLSEAKRAEIFSIYQEDIKALESMLDQDFDVWR